MKYPHMSKVKITYHGRTCKRMIYKGKMGTYIMVRKKGGGTKRKYKY